MNSDKKKHKKKSPYQVWLVPGVIGLVLLAAAGFVVKIIFTADGPRKKDPVVVTLLKPPPPPPDVKEKPPEPVPPKEAPKEIVTPTEAQQPDNSPDQSQDDAPAGSDLGVDGDGGAGDNAFGLRAKKGGRDITIGGGGGGNRLSLMAKYGGYLQKVQLELRQKVNKRLEQDGGIPKGKYQTLVKLVLDGVGTIVDYKIVAEGSSGNQKIERAVREALNGVRISAPPPEGMPKSMTVRISCQG